MCGIAGIFKWYEPLTFEDLTAVQRMLEAQVHRGPDSEGIFIAGAGSQEFAGRIPQAFSLLPPASSSSVVLGHRRLAIIDLSQAGRQPIANEDGAIWVTYNGEIYNFPELREELITQGHVFRSRTDSEVLVHGYEEWGIDKLLSRLRGMFAFALYDASFRGSTGTNDSGSARLILARDRFGIKPLYYCLLSNGGIAFASEVKALRRSGVVSHERDAEALTGFLLFGSVPSPLTILKDVRCLLPGHYLVAQNGDTTLHRHWNLPTFHACQNGENRGTADLHSILKDAVTRHLVSEVPLGIFLSGGIDSAGLVALTSRATHSACKTLTMSFVEKAWSEAQQARQIAEHFSTEYAEVLVRGDDFIRELPEILTAMDQPTTDGVNTYFVAKAARQAGLTVILSGLGGDEVFWGYRHYRWLAQRYLQLLTQLPSVLRNALVSCLSAYGRLRGQERWKRFTYLKGPFSEAGFYLVVRGFFAPDQVEQLLGFDSSTPEATVEKAFALLPLPDNSDGTDAEHFHSLEIQRYLHDQLLRDTDTFGMAHSVEVRVPYLDHMVVEAVTRTSPEQRLHQSVNKPLLVRALGEPAVEEIGKKKKKGFTLPLGKWMKQYANELEPIALQADFLERRAIHSLWRAFVSGRLHWSRAWALVVLGAKG